MDLFKTQPLFLDASSSVAGVPQSSLVGDAPSTLDPTLWAMEILEYFAYADLLYHRSTELPAGSSEEAWVKLQYEKCLNDLVGFENAEQAYEKANPGKTYLDPAFCQLLQTGIQEIRGGASFPTWWQGVLKSDNFAGSGKSFVDWIMANLKFPAWDPNQPELLAVAGMLPLLFIDAETNGIPNVDILFSEGNPSEPQWGTFGGDGAEALYFWFHSQDGSSTDLGYFLNLVTPQNLSVSPGPNYSYFFSIFSQFPKNPPSEDINTFFEGYEGQGGWLTFLNWLCTPSFSNSPSLTPHVSSATLSSFARIEVVQDETVDYRDGGRGDDWLERRALLERRRLLSSSLSGRSETIGEVEEPRRKAIR